MTGTGIATRMTEEVKAKMTGITKGMMTQMTVKAKIWIISPGQSQKH